jgi:hypothetical protein
MLIKYVTWEVQGGHEKLNGERNAQAESKKRETLKKQQRDVRVLTKQAGNKQSRTNYVGLLLCVLFVALSGGFTGSFGTL